MPSVFPTPGMNTIVSRSDPNYEYFECPECSSDNLEEVARAITYSTIPCFYRGEHDYGDAETEYMDALRIQCAHCGFTVAEGFPPNLYQHCLERGWIRNREATSNPAADWEA